MSKRGQNADNFRCENICMTFKPHQTSDFMREFGGADRDRTDDLLNAIQALSQLSYGPTRRIKGKGAAFLLRITLIPP